MRIALYQTSSPAGDISAGLETLDAALGAAASAGVGMLVLPELFLPGYNAATKDPPPDWDRVYPGLQAMCRTHGMAMTIGLPEYDGADIYNSAYVIGADGEDLARYRKVQLFGPRENAIFTPGDQLVVFDYQGIRFGLMICYDVEFPEHTRALTRAGAKVILTPTANMMPFVTVADIQVPGRALENGVTIVYANYCGSEGDLTYVGDSLICGPDGYPLGRMGKKAGLLSVDLPEGQMPSGLPLSTQLRDYRPAKEP